MKKGKGWEVYLHKLFHLLFPSLSLVLMHSHEFFCLNTLSWYCLGNKRSECAAFKTDDQCINVPEFRNIWGSCKQFYLVKVYILSLCAIFFTENLNRILYFKTRKMKLKFKNPLQGSFYKFTVISTPWRNKHYTSLMRNSSQSHWHGLTVTIQQLNDFIKLQFLHTVI